MRTKVCLLLLFLIDTDTVRRAPLYTLQMDYAPVVQQLRLAQAALLGVSAVALYSEADRIGLSSFLLPFALICLHLYFVLTRWQGCIDGRYDFEGILASSGLDTQIHYGVQVFAPFVLSVLVHFASPIIPSSSTSTVFNLSHYFTIVAAAIVLVFDVYGGTRKKI